MCYLKLRKIKRLIEENDKDIINPHTDDELRVLMQTQMHLKKMERALLQGLGTVIVK